jgi:hypothetical protein
MHGFLDFSAHNQGATDLTVAFHNRTEQSRHLNGGALSESVSSTIHRRARTSYLARSAQDVPHGTAMAADIDPGRRAS